MANTPGDFIWYELLSADVEASKAFYGGLIGWDFTTEQLAAGSYHLFAADGPPVGGMLELTDEMRNNGAQPLWSSTIAVDDVDATADSVTRAGGSILMPAWDIPSVGRLAFVADPQGAMFYIMRPDGDQPSESFAQLKPRIGHCAWNELTTTDPQAAEKFYAEVFGWVMAESMDMGPAGQYNLYKNGAERDFMMAGMMQKPDAMPVSLWSHYFRVPNIDAAVDYINNNGGKVVSDPMQVPGGDYAISAIDPQQAFFSLIGAR